MMKTQLALYSMGQTTALTSGNLQDLQQQIHSKQNQS
jgi:hypothetical protein